MHSFIHSFIYLFIRENLPKQKKKLDEKKGTQVVDKYIKWIPLRPQRKNQPRKKKTKNRNNFISSIKTKNNIK